jgi:NAD(P)-dependent dehydrogenase (short-subunit alcohol dehydrogenase family)
VLADQSAAARPEGGSFAGKVVIVTGAGHGCGRVAALAFAREGAKVVVADIDDEGGEATIALIEQAGGDGRFIHTDVRHEDDVAAMVTGAVDAYGRLDCAFNNAGVELSGLIVDQTGDNCDLMMDTNLKGVFFCTKHEIAQMAKTSGGAIVNHASVTSSIIGTVKNGVYGATKGAIIGLTRSAALEAAPHNISVNAIASCAIDTPNNMFWRWVEEYNIPVEQFEQAIPLGRLGKPEELAAAVLYLCSDQARYVVGTTLILDGGVTAQ